MNARQILFASMVPMTAAGMGCSDITAHPTAPTYRQQWTQQSALAPVLSIQISPSVESMRFGETVSFWVKVELGDGVPPSGAPGLSWSSTNPSVITIDSSGNATAIGRGATTIEVIFKGLKATRAIHVP